MAFDKLTVEQFIGNGPVVFPGTFGADPVAEMGSDGIEIAAQAVGGEGRNAIFLQTKFQVMGQGHGILVLAKAEMKRGQDLGERVDGEPQPHAADLADSAEELIHLDEGQEQVMEEALMQVRAVVTSSFQPAGDGGLSMTGAAHEDRNITPLSQEHQDQDDALFRDLEAVERRISTGGKGLPARLTFPILNVIEQTAFAISNKGMELVISYAEVITAWVGAGVAL